MGRQGKTADFVPGIWLKARLTALTCSAALRVLSRLRERTICAKRETDEGRHPRNNGTPMTACTKANAVNTLTTIAAP
jgi:hypothetical protein